jgi:hypothetical protein
MAETMTPIETLNKRKTELTAEELADPQHKPQVCVLARKSRSYALMQDR